MEKIETLIDYVRWRGDLTFKQMEFNVIDNLILCEVSYLDLAPVLEQNSNTGVTIHDAYQMIHERDIYRLLTANGGSEDLLAEIASSKRFGNIEMTQFIDILDASHTQFSAVTFSLWPGMKYVAYRGTDDSIIGWKEDFMISFTQTVAQKLAVDYARKQVGRGQYYIGGHSKGANLAVYAAAYLKSSQQRRIKRVFMNDGPGFCDSVFEMDVLHAVYPMVTKIVPTYDIIGQIFHEELEDYSIVKSSYKGILQHDMASWRVDGPKLCTSEYLDPTCQFLNETINAWVKHVDATQRERFVNEFFDALSAGGAVTMEEISTVGLKQVLEALGNLSDTTKQTAFALPKTALNMTKLAIEEKAEQWFKKNEDKE